MLTLVRETLKRQLARVPALADLQAQGDGGFPLRLQAWLHETEQQLTQLRRPEAATLGALRSKLVACRDGLRDPQVPADLPPRKALRAAAALHLSSAEQTLRESLRDIEAYLQPQRAQLAQLVSAAHLLSLLPLPAEGPREQWLHGAWTRLGESDKTRGMFVYLSTSLAPTDRLYLLDDLLTNLNL